MTNPTLHPQAKRSVAVPPGLARRIKSLRLPDRLPRRYATWAIILGAALASALIALLFMHVLWLFVLIFLDGIVPLIPGEAALLSQAPGAFAAGWPAVLALAGLAAVAAFLGDATTYHLGRWVGTTRFAWQRHHRVARLLDRTGTALERRGLPLIVTARLLPGWRVAITFMAGATGLRRRRFLAASALGAMMWAVYLLGIGTTIGAITGGGPILVAVISLATTAVLARTVRWLRNKLWSSRTSRPSAPEVLRPDTLVNLGARVTERVRRVIRSIAGQRTPGPGAPVLAGA